MKDLKNIKQFPPYHRMLIRKEKKDIKVDIKKHIKKHVKEFSLFYKMPF